MQEKTCIIIPCFNEALRLKSEEYLAFTEQVQGIDFCFVNDGSSDSTGEILEKLCLEHPGRLYCVNYSDNRGKAEAVRTGMNEMLKLQQYHKIGYADADLATPLQEIRRLTAIFDHGEDVQMVMGSRIKRMGVTIERKLFRHYLGRLFATIVALLFRFNAYDTQCGAKVFSNNIAGRVFERPFISPWLFDVEILLRIKKIREDYNQSVKEIPLECWLEQGGSKIRISHLLKIPIELFKIYFEYK